jgi:hypothetical protein
MKKRIVSVLCIFVFLLSACGTTAQEQSQEAPENTVVTIGCKDGSPLPQELVELGTALGYDLGFFLENDPDLNWDSLVPVFLAGDKSAEEVAALIQNHVEIYLGEQQ